MATGMQTGRRTGQTPLRTGVSPAGNAGGGGVGGILQKWTDLDTKMKTIIIVVGVVLIVSVIAFSTYTSSNKFVPLYSTSLTSSDAQTISTELSQMGIPYEMAEGGMGILIHPTYKRRALLILASKGLPSRRIVTTNAGGDEGGFAPPTREEKDRKYLQQLTGDLTETIRQIDGIADAYIKIVPKPQSAWGAEEKATASASIMLKMVPGAKISKKQIQGIVQLVAYSVDGLLPENVKIVDTTGKVLNNMIGESADAEMAEGGSGIKTKEMMETEAMEDKIRQRLQASLDKMLGGPGKSEVQVSVELDFSQKEMKSIKHGGPANVDGKVVVGELLEKETYTSDPGKSSGGTEQMSSGSGDKSNYIKIKKTTRVKTDQVETRVVNTAHSIKRISCGVMLNGVNDPKAKANIEAFVKESIGYTPSRGDTVAVNSFPFTNTHLLDEMNNRPAAAAVPPGGFASDREASAQMPPWAWAAMAVPILLVIMLVMLFYIKQKNVQKEKQRLVLTTGPGATVSDISDLLSDKEGKITPPAATKVNTTDQLEKLAKEKPTKVAELLKSTWLADQ